MMFIKPSFVLGFAAGYVLGSRAGRERYEQIATSARRIAGNPTVQSAASKAQETVVAQAPVVADAVKDKATSAASAVADKVTRDSDPAPAGTHTRP
ncbi:hypothetical protein GCM10027062_26800 [Nocardioides hungaricus]